MFIAAGAVAGGLAQASRAWMVTSVRRSSNEPVVDPAELGALGTDPIGGVGESLLDLGTERLESLQGLRLVVHPPPHPKRNLPQAFKAFAASA
ncbi:hypothetical protein EV643_13921 [Kribbella sp. VKM Ac-2527]|uniref:Uncharacterized protein n=1 Tax=Kribbella caucasensis TaxID=2512215 RepID=A0A4R6J4B0_9ACTN|nr:hypothetical protein EV643_13921 [Kribbella sp. VKM Ac-2527]